MNHLPPGDVELSEQVDVVVAQTVVKLPNIKWIKGWPGHGVGSYSYLYILMTEL